MPPRAMHLQLVARGREPGVAPGQVAPPHAAGHLGVVPAWRAARVAARLASAAGRQRRRQEQGQEQGGGRPAERRGPPCRHPPGQQPSAPTGGMGGWGHGELSRCVPVSVEAPCSPWGSAGAAEGLLVWHGSRTGPQATGQATGRASCGLGRRGRHAPPGLVQAATRLGPAHGPTLPPLAPRRLGLGLVQARIKAC